jgi:hypothetical protein
MGLQTIDTNSPRSNSLYKCEEQTTLVGKLLTISTINYKLESTFFGTPRENIASLS